MTLLQPCPQSNSNTQIKFSSNYNKHFACCMLHLLFLAEEDIAAVTLQTYYLASQADQEFASKAAWDQCDLQKVKCMWTQRPQ